MKKNKKKIFAIISTLLLGVIFATMGLAGCKEKGFDESSNVAVVVREDGSGTKGAFMEIIGLKKGKDVTGAITASSTAAVLENVKTNKNAIGYDSLGYVTSDVKKLKVDGVEATVANIIAGTYKISRPLQVLYKTSSLEGTSDQNKANNAFFKYMKSKEAQTIIEKEGYVASNKATALSFEKDNSIATKQNVAVSGSTSLEPLMKEIAKEFQKVQPNVTVNVTGGGSGQGATDAGEGTSVFGMISRERAADDPVSCDGLYEVAKDGIAVIVNLANTFDNISLEDLKAIFNADPAKGAQITQWSNVKK